jgi:hypothetical protein
VGALVAKLILEPRVHLVAVEALDAVLFPAHVDYQVDGVFADELLPAVERLLVLDQITRPIILCNPRGLCLTEPFCPTEGNLA